MRFNFIPAIFILFFLSPILISIFFFILLSTFKNPIYYSKRIGVSGKIFFMPKFRTMKMETPQLATHLLINSKNYLYFYGNILRKFSLDEIPQIFSVLNGDINFIGPRPALYNQVDLMKLRSKYNIDKVKPGITGFAQVKGRDNLTLRQKVKYEKFYEQNKSFKLKLIILYLTICRLVINSDVSH